MSWSELRGGSSASSGGSLRLSQSKAKKLMEECDGPDLDLDDWGVHRVHPPSKSNKEKVSLLSRLFRKSSTKKRSSSTNSGAKSSVKTFCTQFPPPEWFQPVGTA